jgi:hypothetical protein
MILSNWIEFQFAFNHYISKTVGLFTLYDDSHFIHFRLDYFFERIHERLRNNRPLSLTQAEMFAALSTFIDIEESYHRLSINTFPINIKLYLKMYIEKKWIQLSPFSHIKADCLNVLGPNAQTASAA